MTDSEHEHTVKTSNLESMRVRVHSTWLFSRMWIGDVVIFDLETSKLCLALYQPKR